MIPKKVIIFGGTHGNEWTGIMAVKEYPAILKKEFKDLDLHIHLANPEAYRINKRFKDEDLNRAFQFLHEERPLSYENGRARELKSLIDLGACFVLDLHTTTSNMGNTVIISHDEPLNFHIASHLVKKLADTRVILSPDRDKKYLASQSRFGMMVEVGPVSNGVINGAALEATMALIRQVLQSLSTLTTITSGQLEIYEESEDIFYPQNAGGELTSYIHPDFQGKDFAALEGSYIPFKSFLGEDESRVAQEKVYPIFINEAAYYPMKLAYTLCKKRILKF